VFVLLALVGLVAPAAGAAERIPVALKSPDCRGVAARTATPVGISRCSGVRPGAFFTTSVGGCSFNFAFKGSDGARYIGTAGHCLLENEGEKRWAVGRGLVVRDGDDRKVGRTVYAILKDSQNKDFGLIRLSPHIRPAASMCHFGGPTRLDTSHLATPQILEHYGQGLGVSILTPARTSVAPNTLDEDAVIAVGAAAFGDSGSGATRQGRALGVIVAVGAGIDGTGSAGDVFVTRLQPQLARAQRVLGIKLTLATAPRR
jgi:hypothetical protein